MLEIFSQRWVDSYGATPTPLWQLAIDSARDGELKRAIAALMRGGTPHPPTLPEFVELLKHGGPKGKGAPLNDGPLPYTPEWNEQRKALFARIAKEQQAKHVPWSERDRARSRAALALIDNPPGSAGHDDALRAYRAAG